MSHQPSARALWTAVAAALLAAPAAQADEAPNLLTDSFQVAIGTFIINTEPTVTLNGDTSRGDPINFKDEIGGGDASRLRLDSSWRFGDSDKHKVKLIAFGMKRDNSRTIDRDIEWGGDTYPVNAKVDFGFKFGVIEAAYEYNFLHSDRYEIGASAGLHYMTFSSSLKAKASESGGTLNEDLSHKASVGAPLPVFGVHGLWDLTHHFWLDASAQYFALSIDEYDGSLQDYRVLLTWQPNKWAGVGVGFNRFDVNVDVSKDNFNGTLDWKYQGPMIYYSISF